MNPLETYLRELRDIHSTGAAVPETSYYGCLERLLNEIGKTLKPKVRCVINLANRGAGIPDGGLFTAEQIKKDDLNPMQGLSPSRGVIEVKSTSDDVATIASGEQVARYCKKYGLVLVTNYRDFTLVARDPSGKLSLLESYRLAAGEDEFWAAAAHPHTAAEQHGERFAGYLMRSMQHNAPLADPKDLAWFLASYARDALARVKGSNPASSSTSPRQALPALANLRQTLEESLGMKFRGDRGEHFFESTLIQTLFYGVFSAWVLWAKEHPPTDKTQFDWMHSASYLRVPVLRKLFHEAADPGQLDALNLSEVLNWATTALNRVDRAAFFEKFQQHHAVQYFYEPFLEAYDPELRKQLGVWYTPPEIVQYMVKRVDRVLREELAVEDGLADPRVYVLDPCCGTGAFLVGVLDQIAATLRDKGGDALLSHDLKQAVCGNKDAEPRIFGFEILPAPYVVSHLQLGLRLTDFQVPLTGKQRVGVYLTNALTGWEPPKEPQARLPFVEFQEEHDAADSVKQSTPILVILGNPPYNGFSDVEMGEERDLSLAYRETKKAPKPQGQGLNDLYVRFFRMAERRIVDKTHKGIVCFISNYSWLDGLSHTGMRERYIEAFDKIWIDCLNGDKYKTGKLTPDGKPDPSVFSTETNRVGIQVGTAISLMVRKEQHEEAGSVEFRHLWGKAKRAELLASADNDGKSLYETLKPPVELGLPFRPGVVAPAYLQWPLLPDLLPTSFPGIQPSRDEVVTDIDEQNLIARMKTYFNPKVGDDDIRRIMPRAMEATARFDPVETRRYLVRRGFLPENIVPILYRPFDMRWLYWEPETKLLDEKRAEYVTNINPSNIWLAAVQQNRKEFDPPISTAIHNSRHVIERGANMFPLLVHRTGKQAKLFGGDSSAPKPNLSEQAMAYLQGLGFADLNTAAEHLFYHILAVLHAPAYREENAGALRQDWPRIPLPATRTALEASAALGRRIAALLDVTQPVRGVTTGKIDPQLKAIGLITKRGTGVPPASGTGVPPASPTGVPPVGQQQEHGRDGHATHGQALGAPNGDAHATGRARRAPAVDAHATVQINDADDLAVTAGWGNPGRGGITMPAGGKAVARGFSPEELIALCGEPEPPEEMDAITLFGGTTLDIYLNDRVYWRNIPAAVWEYTLGGYQVIKKWLSYREHKMLGRALRADEARYVTEMARRIAAILLMQPDLDKNYRCASANAYAWQTAMT
jgi:hypothetical protein